MWNGALEPAGCNLGSVRTVGYLLVTELEKWCWKRYPVFGVRREKTLQALPNFRPLLLITPLINFMLKLYYCY